MEQRDRFQGALLGLACGDALGTTVEFSPRGSFAPLEDIVGGGPFGLEPGQWTDDTSMALCLAASLIMKQGFDARDQMNRYVSWYEDGYFSSNGTCFDIGNTVSQALHDYLKSGDPYAGSTDPYAAGNGSLMRLAPVILYYFPDEEAIRTYTAESSKTTHATQECLDACMLFGVYLSRALQGQSKEQICQPVAGLSLEGRLEKVARGGFLQQTEDDVRGTGYVVDCIEAAMWCFAHTESFEQAALRAANLGDDADTTGAVVGQIAGAHYGASGIPEHWVQKVTKASQIKAMAVALMQA